MTGWQVGIALGVVVILVAAVIVITIVRLAPGSRNRRRPRSARSSGARPDGLPRGHRADQRLGRADPALRPCTKEGGGRQMSHNETGPSRWSSASSPR